MFRPLCVVALAFVLAVPARAQAPQQFRAYFTSSGGSLDEPATGTMYYGGEKVRFELTADGERMTLIADPAAQVVYMLMVDEKMYMEMPVGFGGARPPEARSLDPNNPCSNRALTSCQRLGEETVNGYSTTRWSYVSDGEPYTAWIANTLHFPVRTVDSDGTTTDFTDIQMGTQAASLFVIPDDYEPMDLGFAGAFGAGRGMVGGRRGAGGAVPTGGFGGTGSAPTTGTVAGFPAGFDPASLGLDSAAIAMITAMSAPTPTGAGAWEGGDGWILGLTITADASFPGGSFAARYTASLPLNYGTPGMGAMAGPRWQHIAGLGSPAAEAERITLSAEYEYHHEASSTVCEAGAWPFRSDLTMRGRYDGSASMQDATGEMVALGYIQLAGDLQTFSLAGGVVGRTGTWISEGQEERFACPGHAAAVSSNDGSGEEAFAVQAAGEMTDLPLPSSPQTMTGSTSFQLTTPRAVPVTPGFPTQIPATLVWTLTPIGSP